MSNENKGAALDESKTIPLRRAVGPSDSVDRFELKAPNAGQVAKFIRLGKTDEGDAINTLVSEVSGVPKPLVEKADWRDVADAMEYLSPFVSHGQKTETS
ncbi:MAG TPA: phage tail assembly protein [Rhizomicrobium sp.]|jgi:hypothetical protein|nr:phage tail assembly protein [Rhizomicrobium sp.]